MRQVLGARFVHRLHGLLTEIPRLARTADAIALASRIVALIEAEARPEAEPDAEEDARTRPDQDQGGENPEPRTQPTPLDVKPALQVALEATEAELPENLFEAVAETLGHHSGDAPTLLPSLEQYAGDPPQGWLALNRVKGQSAKLTARLQGLIEAHTLEKSRAARCGRRLSAPHLYRIAVGDARIFRRKESKVAPNTALHLLVDLSGSMAGGQDGMALEAAMALALALETIQGVSCAVSAFPGIAGEDDKITRILSQDDRVSARAGAFIQRGWGSTPMTGALWFAAADLLARQEARKVILTLTDGAPDDCASAVRLVRQATMAGIQMIGVGVEVDVAWLFPVAIQIQTVANLKAELFRVAEQLLMR